MGDDWVDDIVAISLIALFLFVCFCLTMAAITAYGWNSLWIFIPLIICLAISTTLVRWFRRKYD